MKETILIKVGEIALKGLNRRSFEDVLIKNIKRRVNCITPCEVKIAQLLFRLWILFYVLLLRVLLKPVPQPATKLLRVV